MAETKDTNTGRFIATDDDIVFDAPGDDEEETSDEEEDKPVKAATLPPTRVLDYWRDYDSLMETLGDDWLHDYMLRAWSQLAGSVTPDMSPADVQQALDSYHDEFAAAWLGTEDKPGPLQRLILAGMGAAQTAIYDGTTANPQRPVQAKALAVDWNLLSKEARNFAQTYLYNLIRNIDETTQKEVQTAIAKWMDSGEPLDKLQSSLETIFKDKARARLIAQTETTRAYAEGGAERYRRADVKRVKWNTVRAADVCPICDELGKMAPQPIDTGFKTKEGRVVMPPAHPGCRCWLRPVVSDEE